MNGNFMLISDDFVSIVALGMLQCGFFVVFAPFLNTLMKKIKAMLQNRQGPRLLQGYYDLRKWFKKEAIIPDTATALFTVSPPLVFASILTSSMLLPTFLPIASLQPMGGVILLVGLLGLSRFMMAAAAMESPGGFCGMGSSRELMLGALVEPVMLLSLFVFAMFCESSNFYGIFHKMSHGISVTPAMLVALLSLYISVVAEMGRVPFDNPETHYELTMIHEGMMLEYSGSLLALLHWASWIKQMVLLSLIAFLLPPYHLPNDLSASGVAFSFLYYGGKLLILCIFTAVVETVVAKIRVFRNKDILGGALVLALLALILAAQDLSGVAS
jgi:formate hydrogenlyase subunit 4